MDNNNEERLASRINYVRESRSSSRRPLLSTGAAIALGLSAIIVTAIIVAGVVFTRGANFLETLETLDINVTGEVTEEQGDMQVNVDINQETQTGVDIDWSSVDIVSLMQAEGIDGEVYLPSFGFSESVDLTGDGLSDAIFGGHGGNAGIALIVINNESQPEIAYQKDQLGFISPVRLYSVGRVAASLGYQLLPEENAYYTVEKLADHEAYDPQGGTVFVCENFSAYVWDEMARMFEYNQALSDQYYAQECS